jgi:hypothetical protein
VVAPRLKGRYILVRYADDLVMAFEDHLHRVSAHRVGGLADGDAGKPEKVFCRKSPAICCDERTRFREVTAYWRRFLALFDLVLRVSCGRSWSCSGQSEALRPRQQMLDR